MNSDVRFLDMMKLMDHSITGALHYVGGMSEEDFLDDPRTIDAVLMKLIVIGEVSSDILRKCPHQAKTHPDVAWLQMKGVRNRIAHGYFETDKAMIWEATQQDLPATRHKLRQCIKEFEQHLLHKKPSKSKG